MRVRVVPGSPSFHRVFAMLYKASLATGKHAGDYTHEFFEAPSKRKAIEALTDLQGYYDEFEVVWCVVDKPTNDNYKIHRVA